MGRKEVLAERRALENFYYNCKLETPQEVAKQFEVYTRLIWNSIRQAFATITTATRLSPIWRAWAPGWEERMPWK